MQDLVAGPDSDVVLAALLAAQREVQIASGHQPLYVVLLGLAVEVRVSALCD